jgi:1,4-dihydroxy-2-naphthoate octaprenyltransferase
MMSRVVLALAGAIGAYFLLVWGLSVLPLGLLGLLLIVAYTPWITRYALLCLLAPGVGFGLLMVMGTDFVLTGTYTWTSFVASLVPSFLVSNLLLLNQFPDVEADRTVGRRHFPISAGRRFSSILYAILLLLAYLSIVVGVVLGLLPTASLLGLLTVAVAVPLAAGVYRNGEQVAQLVRYMGLNVLVTVTTPVLVAIGLLIAA